MAVPAFLCAREAEKSDACKPKHDAMGFNDMQKFITGLPPQINSSTAT